MQPKQYPSLLLVHGAWHGAWYWEEKFAPWLRQQGLNVVTMDLPGHGTPGPKRIGWYSIRDYVDAVESKLSQINGPVIVAGHSMGGYVVQKLMERRPQNLAGAILIAAASVSGVWGVVGKLLRNNPIDFLLAQLKLDLYHLVRTPERARAKFYSSALPKQELDSYWARISNESYRAFLDMLGFNPIHPERAKPEIPKLVIGGGQDAIFSSAKIQAIAQSYGVQAKIFDPLPHSLNLDLGWEQVAQLLVDWLSESFVTIETRTASNG